MNGSDVLEALRKHEGSSSGIRAEDLAREITGDDNPVALRTLRTHITALRMQGVPICGHPNTGYYLAGSAADITSTCAFLRSRAMTSLLQEARLKRISLPRLLGQMLLDTEPAEEPEKAA